MAARERGRRRGATRRGGSAWEGSRVGGAPAYAPPRRVCLVSIDLLTGRQHQIRVHCAHRGAAVANDEAYDADVATFVTEGLLLLPNLVESGELSRAACDEV